jgi:hypothetical protein
MARKQKKSAVIELLDLVYDRANEAVEHSWERLNHAMRHALELAVGAGFTFAESDIAYVHANYRSGYWLGESSEWVYALAIGVGNLTAAKSYEAYAKREPFIADDVRLHINSQGYTNGDSGKRQRERLAVGSEFPWKGATARVTSFSGDGLTLTACTYKPRNSNDHLRERIDKRYKISRDDIIADRAERKERKELHVKATAFVLAGKLVSGEFLKRLGVESQAEFDAVPIAKVRKVAEWLESTFPAEKPVKAAA